MGGQINTNSTFGSSNFAGSVQTLVSSNVTSGFSICKLNPGGNSNITFGHELGVAPQWVLVKNLVDGATNWQVLHQDVGSGRKIFLNSSSGSSSDTNMWQNTDPTSSVVSMGTAQTTNENVIAYCWAEIAGFSKFGVYNGKGNGSTTDGPFIETGFSPAWLMIKRSGATENWFIFNNKSDPYNPAGRYILADGTNVENDHSGGNDVDFLANGFRLRANNAGTNTFDNSYIYMTFAENPFAGSTPMTAR